MGENRHIADEARERASSYAPLPKWEPLHAGLTVASFVAVIVLILVGVTGLELMDLVTVLVSVAAIGFILPFGYFWNQKRVHYDAWTKEFNKLMKEQDRQKGA